MSRKSLGRRRDRTGNLPEYYEGRGASNVKDDFRPGKLCIGQQRRCLPQVPNLLTQLLFRQRSSAQLKVGSTVRSAGILL